MRTLFLGDIGNRLDIGDAEREIAALQARFEANVQLDGDQEQRLERLERENADLKLCLASLTRTLVRKGALGEADVEAFVSILDPPSAR